jgi:outer membrane protein OmpA-like peptidoglycan-associated protein
LIPSAATVAPAISVLEDSVFFVSGARTLAPAEARKLDALVQVAQSKNARLKVIGFASATGSGSPVDRQVRNFNISMDRANLVASLLIQSGLPASAVVVEARGEDQQASFGAPESFSRRADIYFEY